MNSAAATLIDVRLRVNDCEVSASVDTRTSLAVFLRDHLNLLGTRMGCDTAQCGACTVSLEGRAVKSCNVLVAQVHERGVTTIEGLVGTHGELHPIQECFRDHHALQCGFCTSGMVMRAYELMETLHEPSDSKIREALDGNLCRCTGYYNIVAAIKEVITRHAGERSTCGEYMEDDASV